MTAQPPGLGDWVKTADAQLLDSGGLVASYAAFLVARGVTLARLTVSLSTLHPQQRAEAMLWRRGQPIEYRAISHTFDRAAFDSSPLHRAYVHGESVRRRLLDPDCPRDYSILPDLEAEGVTDYLVLPLRFSDGSQHAMTIAVDGADGIRPEDEKLLADGAIALTPRLEVRSLRRLASTLCETYLGAQTGPQVLEGRILPGSVDLIDCVLWFSDIRNFTEQSEALDAQELVDRLNAHFGRIGAAIDAHGGEILKFLGDGVLAMFPVANPGAALSAARAALADEAAAAGFAFGIAIHVGRVIYGNVGAENRLDFTVLGAAVNLTSRLSSLCRTLDRPLLVSGAYAALIDQPVQALGDHRLKGVTEPVSVFEPI